MGTSTKSQVNEGGGVLGGQGGSKVFPIVLEEGLLSQKLAVIVLNEVGSRATTTRLFFGEGPIQDVGQDVV